MATITGLTKERMLEIEGASVVSGVVTAAHLILTKHDGSTVDAGYVIGPGANILVVTRATRPTGVDLFEGLMIYETDTRQIFTYDEIETAWIYRGGTMLMSASARPDEPFPGLSIYDIDTHEYLIYAGPVVQWQRPWNMPWGVLDVKRVSASQTAIGALTSLTGLSSTLTIPPGRRIKISAEGRFIKNTSGYCSLYVEADGADRVLYRRAIPNNEQCTPQGWYIDDNASGSTTYELKAEGNESAGTVDAIASVTNKFTMTIEDVGPSGDPS